jgi:putative transposase
VRKRQARLTGLDDLVISLSATGLTHGEIAAHLAEVYGAEVSKQTISTTRRCCRLCRALCIGSTR